MTLSFPSCLKVYEKEEREMRKGWMRHILRMPLKVIISNDELPLKCVSVREGGGVGVSFASN